MPTKPWPHIISVLLKSEDFKNTSSFTGTHITHAKDFLPVSLQTKQLFECKPKIPSQQGEKGHTHLCPEFGVFQFLQQTY